MSALTFVLLCFAVLVILALRRAPIEIWAGCVGALTLIAQIGLPYGEPVLTLLGGAFAGWILTAVLAALSVNEVRKKLVIAPAFDALKKIMPRISDTEREALEAGTIGWDAELFSGEPDWRRLRDVPAMSLSAEERAFLDGPTDELCRMTDDWDIRHNRNLPPKKRSNPISRAAWKVKLARKKIRRIARNLPEFLRYV